jgi:hypothetical protein
MPRVTAAFSAAIIATISIATGSSLCVTAPETNLPASTVKISEDHKIYTIEVDYPKFKGDDPDVLAVNGAIKNEVMKHLNAMRPLLARIKRTAPGAADGVYDFSCASTTQLATKDLISVTFSCEEYVDTMPHPSHYNFSINYQLHPLRKLTLATLFNPTSGYLKKLSAECRALVKKQVKADGGDTGGIDENLTANAQTLRTFALHKQGIEFIFDQGAVLDYTQDGPSAMVPWKDVRDLLLADTAVAKLAQPK